MTTSINKAADMVQDIASMAQPDEYSKELRPLDVAFGLDGHKDFVSRTTGKGIPIDVLKDTPFPDMVPRLDSEFVLDPELSKNIAVGVGENMPILLYGYHGSGKSSLLKQFAAATERPYLRIQHTGNTEESDVLGQTLVKDGATYFEPGPLPLAMRFGFFLNLDEYDMAVPSVTAVYQPVLEGEALYIKEAPPEWRHVKPHPDFRVAATGNTNGSGDETGLYQGTSLGNAANYSRFSITCFVDYMEKKKEIEIIMKKAEVRKEDATNFAKFAEKVRDAFATKKITTTIGQRELIAAAKLGVARVSWVKGLELAYINRLSKQDEIVVRGLMQHVFPREEGMAEAV